MLKMASIIKEYISNLYLFLSDFINMMHSLSKRYQASNLERNILLQCHALEKGMTFTEKKNNWGKDKCLALCKAIEGYTSITDTSNAILIYAINTLKNYRSDSLSSKNAELNKKISNLLDKYNNYIRTKWDSITYVVKPHAFNKKIIVDFFNTRSSIRTYSSQAITNQEIMDAVSFAHCTPTACNRQSARVYAFKDKNKIASILDEQLGNQGWCNNAQALIVITGVQSYFNGNYERHQVFIDGGLFAMNLIYGLHLQNIASCFKMYVRRPKTDKIFKNICNIPENEQPIVLILCGHYCEGVSISTASPRFNTPLVIDGERIESNVEM